MYGFLVAGILLIVLVQRNAQAVISKRVLYLGHDHGSFASPNYPLSYSGGVRYTWIMPVHFQTIRIEFIELDLYTCHVDEIKRFCDDFDYVYIGGNVKEFYCNWNRPTKSITILPWTQASIIFYSGYSSRHCKGRGFKAEYRTVRGSSGETTRWPTTIMSTMSTTTKTEAPGNTEGRHQYFSALFLLLLLAIPLIMVVACLYWCFRTSRQNPAVNQEVLQTAIDNWNYQTATTPAVPRPTQNTSRDGTHLTVDLPPLTRTETASRSCEGVNRQIRLPRRNDDGGPEIPDHDPPPSYDNVWEDDSLNRSQSFEPPPSYEDAMRESNQSLENLARHEENENMHYYDGPRGSVRTLNLQSNNTNEANLEVGSFEVTI